MRKGKGASGLGWFWRTGCIQRTIDPVKIILLTFDRANQSSPLQIAARARLVDEEEKNPN
jgi:hypothetical protein